MAAWGPGPLLADLRYGVTDIWWLRIWAVCGCSMVVLFQVFGTQGTGGGQWGKMGHGASSRVESIPSSKIRDVRRDAVLIKSA